jgi:hypothetical protein
MQVLMFKPGYITIQSCLLFLVMSLSVPAQDFKSVIAELRKKYENNEKLHVSMDIAVFESSSAKVPYYTEHADISREGLNFRYRLSSNELLMNSKYTIIVDKTAKQISCTNRDLKSESEMKDPFKMNMDSIFNIIGQPQYVGSNNDGAHYRLIQKENVIQQIDLYINLDKSYMNRIEYRYNDGQWAKIDITLFDVTPIFDPQNFHESSYVQVNNGKLKVSNAFLGYTILDTELDQ